MNLNNFRFLTIVFSVLTLHAQPKDIIGYYPSWRWQERNQLVTQHSIPYEKLTIINYAFFTPTPTGDLVGIDPDADKYILGGDIDPETGKLIPNTSLCAIANEHGVNVMLSIGGWEDSGNFPAIAADPAKRNRFAESCAKAIETYGFNGIDIDWEFPGLDYHNGTPEDKLNFTLLLQDVRNHLDRYGELTNTYYPLSIAASAAPSVADNIEVRKVAEILDFINIMTYDFHGAWESTANHNAPLFAQNENDTISHVDAAFRLYHIVYGIPASKLNLGAPFYGRAYSNCTEILETHTGISTIFHEEGIADYQQIQSNIDEFDRYWDTKAKVPYVVSKTKPILISYDDVESIREKAAYINDQNARGVIIWQIMGDFFDNGETPLLDAINQEFKPNDE